MESKGKRKQEGEKDLRENLQKALFDYINLLHN